MSTLKEVDITPCPQAAEKKPKPCELKRGTEETIEVKFTPSKNSLLFLFPFFRGPCLPNMLCEPASFSLQNSSLRSMRLEVMGVRKKGGARGKHVRCVSLVRPVLSYLPTLSKQ